MDGPTQTRVADHPRAAVDREWEVFVRETDRDPLRHVGSVTAPDEDRAHERATALFDGAAGLWLCPADAVVRYASHDLVTGEGGR
ncbi:MAG: Htur_1727 family rSAM-partnered candidate RiPP [Haloarculaceae archaeon]